MKPEGKRLNDSALFAPCKKTIFPVISEATFFMKFLKTLIDIIMLFRAIMTLNNWFPRLAK